MLLVNENAKAARPTPSHEARMGRQPQAKERDSRSRRPRWQMFGGGDRDKRGGAAMRIGPAPLTPSRRGHAYEGPDPPAGGQNMRRREASRPARDPRIRP